MLASVTANYSMRAPQEPLCPADFVSGRKREDISERTDEEIAEQIDAALRARAVIASN